MVWTATRLEQLVHAHPTSCRDHCFAALLHYRSHSKSTLCICEQKPYSMVFVSAYNTGADPGFFVGGGALISCSTSTPINHSHSFFFFCGIPVVLENCRSSRWGGGGMCTPCTLPQDPPLALSNETFLIAHFQGTYMCTTLYLFLSPYTWRYYKKVAEAITFT